MKTTTQTTNTYYNQKLSWRERLGFPKYEDPGIDCSKEPTETEQQFKDDCDINKIMNKYVSTGHIEHTQAAQAFYGDVSDLGSFQDSLNLVNAAQEAFMAFPAQLRKKFDNDPQKLITFLANENNRDEAIALGLRNPKKVSVGTITSSTTGAGAPTPPSDAVTK